MGCFLVQGTSISCFPNATVIKTGALRPMSTTIDNNRQKIMLPIDLSADDFFSAFHSEDGKDGITVLRNNVLGKSRGQTTMRVCEISELSDSERPDIIEAFESWSSYGRRVRHQWRIDEIISDLKRANSRTSDPLNDDLRRTYIAISNSEVNGKKRINIEGFVIAKEFDYTTWIACWEIKPDNRGEEHESYKVAKTANYTKTHARRFIGVGRQLLCYAVYRELKTSIEMGFDLDTVTELRAEGLMVSVAYEKMDLVDYIRGHITKTLKILRKTSEPNRISRSLYLLPQATLKAIKSAA